MEEDQNYRKCVERIDQKFNEMKDEIHSIKIDGSVPYEKIMDEFK